MTSRTGSAPGAPDWSRNRVSADPKPCRICGGNAHMTDAQTPDNTNER